MMPVKLFYARQMRTMGHTKQLRDMRDSSSRKMAKLNRFYSKLSFGEINIW